MLALRIRKPPYSDPNRLRKKLGGTEKAFEALSLGPVMALITQSCTLSLPQRRRIVARSKVSSPPAASRQG